MCYHIKQTKQPQCVFGVSAPSRRHWVRWSRPGACPPRPPPRRPQVLPITAAAAAVARGGPSPADIAGPSGGPGAAAARARSATPVPAGVDPTRPQGCCLKDLPSGRLGKLLVYRSGRVKLQIGDVLMDVSAGLPCQQRQDVGAPPARPPATPPRPARARRCPLWFRLPAVYWACPCARLPACVPALLVRPPPPATRPRPRQVVAVNTQHQLCVMLGDVAQRVVISPDIWNLMDDGAPVGAKAGAAAATPAAAGAGAAKTAAAAADGKEAGKSEADGAGGAEDGVDGAEDGADGEGSEDAEMEGAPGSGDGGTAGMEEDGVEEAAGGAEGAEDEGGEEGEEATD